MDDLVGRSILVSGRVQGVHYRASTAERAQKLDLKGWVKNLPTGEVLIEVFGNLVHIEALIDWCKQGPPMASVSNVKIEEIPAREERNFSIVY